MVPKVIAVVPLDRYALRVEFDDGVVTEVELDDDLWGPVFEPLRDAEVFGQARVDHEGRTVTWPTGADLDPLVLHGDFLPAPPSRLRVRRLVGPDEVPTS
jgi:hypothetical protein